MLPPLLSTPCPCVAVILPKQLAKPSHAESDERWDAHKTKQDSTEYSASSSTRSVLRRSSSRKNANSSSRKNPNSPLPKPGRADAVERWDAHKKAASPASPSSSSSGTSSLASSSSKWPINRATSAERCDVHKKQRTPQPQAEPLGDGESSSIGSNDIDTEEEEILWKPRAMYAGPGFAAPVPSMLPMPTSFLVPVA